MPTMSSTSRYWKLNGTIADLRRGPLSARVDVSRPDMGLQQLQLNGQVMPSRLLAVQRHDETAQTTSPWPLQLADAYVRGDDLVASYKPSDDWPYSPQLYWSASSLQGIDGLLGSLSLLISVETHLLDTWPRITVSSQLACQELLEITATTGATKSLQSNDTIRPSKTTACILHRLASAPISYVEIMPPNDFRELTVQQHPNGEVRAQWHVLADFLEKGVIRRSRLHAVFMPRENDVQRALDCCAVVDQRPLPLTA
jgi:hypothetical protein